MQSAVGLAGLALVWGMGSLREAQAQVALGDLHATGNGRLETLYTGAWGNLPGTDTHSLGFGGTGIISGDYYNPNFLSFSLLPYYNRAQDNSDTQSITDASGYNGTLNIFKGSRFPGVVSFEQTWNQSGTFGIPGAATAPGATGLPTFSGLTTVNNGHGFNIGWNALLPGLPTFSVGFGDTGGNSNLLGSTESTTTTNRNLNFASTYNLDGYYMSAGFVHLNNDTDFNGLENGETETATGASNQYRFMVQGPIPYRRSNMSLNLTRSSYSMDDSDGGKDYGTTDTINGNVNLMFPRVPVQLTTVYTDNLLGSIEQQLVSSGEVPLVGLSTPESRSVSVEASTFVNVLPRLMVGGYVERDQEFFAGQNFGFTRVGLTVNYNFVHSLKGLTFYGGLFDNVTQQGNTALGFIGNVNYTHYYGRWYVNGFFLYDQNTETLLAQYTTSTMNYGGTIKRQINPDLSWSSVVNLVKSGFEQIAGDSNHGESFTSMLIWKKASISGLYSKSSGVGILTSSGVVDTTLPTQVLPPGAATLYSGKVYGANISFYPVRHMIVSGAWSKAFGSTSSPILLTNSGNTNYYGFMGYEYRKLIFQAGATKFTQSISNSGTLPTMLTSFTFGVQRWFKGF
jgi:hypothetical protein